MLENPDARPYATGDGSAFWRWLWPALLLSVLLHLLFLAWARGHLLSYMVESRAPKPEIRAFRLERSPADLPLSDPLPQEEKHAASVPVPVDLPSERPSLGRLVAENRATPAAPGTLMAENPAAAAPYLGKMQAAEAAGAHAASRNLDSVREELLKDRPEVPGRPLSEMVAPQKLSGGAVARAGQLAGNGDRVHGFSDLDELLAQTGPLQPETAPILMPSDLLFDYDTIDLRAEALESLAKLGSLIRRNPQATFLIEGHTDSFGPDGYNLELSRRRADSVKSWLCGPGGIDPSRVETVGYGKSRLIAPATGSIQEQQINRRVEIVIRTGPSTATPTPPGAAPR